MCLDSDLVLLSPAQCHHNHNPPVYLPAPFSDSIQNVIPDTPTSAPTPCNPGGFIIMDTKCPWSAKHSRRLRLVFRLTITSCILGVSVFIKMCFWGVVIFFFKFWCMCGPRVCNGIMFKSDENPVYMGGRGINKPCFVAVIC